MLHDRFYSAWIQPTTNVPSGAKISTLVKVRIEKDGRVSKFEIIKPSENVAVNESVAAIAKQVSQVDPPPTGLIKGDHYDVKINFELNTEPENGEITRSHSKRRESTGTYRDSAAIFAQISLRSSRCKCSAIAG